MSSSIALAGGKRQKRLSLPSTAALTAATPIHPADGRTVASVFDGPARHVAAAAPTDRAGDLQALLDTIRQALQTLSAADAGITSLTTLVQSLKSHAAKALRAGTENVTYANITAANAIVADCTRVISDGAAQEFGIPAGDCDHNATLGGNIAVAGTSGSPGRPAAAWSKTFECCEIALSRQAQFTMSDADVAAMSPRFIEVQSGSGANTMYVKVGSSACPAGGSFTTGADFADALAHPDNGLNGQWNYGSAAFTISHAVGVTTITRNSIADNFSLTNFIPTTCRDAVAGDPLVVCDGTATATFYKVASRADAADGTYTSLDGLVGAINASAIGSRNGGGITASNTGRGDAGTLRLVSSGGLIVCGMAAVNLGLNLTPAVAATPATPGIPALPALSGVLTIRIGTNAAHIIAFGRGNGQLRTVNTRAQLHAALADLPDVTGSVDASGRVNLAPMSAAAITIDGTDAVLDRLGLTAATITPAQTGMIAASAIRSDLQRQYNELLGRIDRVAAAATCNGVNLLGNDSLEVAFKDKGVSPLVIGGVRFNAAGLGLLPVSGAGFQNDAVVNDSLGKAEAALTSLRMQAARFAANLGTVLARQDFTRNMVNTPQTGADNLPLPDTGQEGANMLALQTRQQLSTTALSMANQANRTVLRLFG